MPRMAAEERNKRDLLCLRLFLAGVPYREIGAHPGVNLSHATVGQIIHKELQKGGRSAIYEQANIVWLERMESMLRVVYPRALQGDLRAVEAVRRILGTEARYFNIMKNGAGDWDDDDGVDDLEAYRQRRRSDRPRVPADGVWKLPELPPAP
ncbi:hypothetical protein [Mycobacteroides abscessus]|uniref:hypothetical protein n=1 Tax=Mycobacteroides abscessus TaxID=36809 RepID=UPI0019271F4A|nr:hypothetical protein [Mycobacteroides abscessus]MBL3752201.1 hypothetical protein [Mycobacteroides abscessus subsp. massiliense]